MANMLKKVKAREKRERSRLRQLFVMAMIIILFLTAIFFSILWVVTSKSQAERQGLAEQGITLLSQGNLVHARAYLSNAAQKGETTAMEYLAWLAVSSGHYNEALQYALQATRVGGLYSYEVLGNLAIIGVGEGNAKGAAAAISYFEQGALKLAREQVARQKGVDVDDLYINTHGKPLDPPEVKTLAVAIFSEMVDRALPVFSDENEYSEFILKANSKGADSLDVPLGDMFFVGNKRLTANASMAVKYWQQAMTKGEDNSFLRMAGAHWHGYAMARDPQTAIELYSNLIKQKRDPISLYALALISLRQNQPDLNLAIQLFKNAADQGYGPASTALGVLALTESGDMRSVQTARQWFRIAAEEQHDISGRVFYDLMLMSGTGAVRDFPQGFDDMLVVAENFQPAKSIVNLLQRRIDPARVLRESLVMGNLVLKGVVAYREGDPLAPQDLRDPMTGELMPRPFSYYQQVADVNPQLKARFGAHNFTVPSDISKLTLNNTPLLSEDLARLIVQYAPSTGVSMFDQTPMMPRPAAPRVPANYSISDFVPPVNLVEPQLLFAAPGAYTTLPY